jgi:hypothetical protein
MICTIEINFLFLVNAFRHKLYFFYPYNGAYSYDAGRKIVRSTSFRSSIRTKIIFVIILLVVVSLSVVGWVASRHSRVALTEQAEKALKLYAEQKVEQYALNFARIQGEVDSAAAYAGYLYADTHVPRLNRLIFEDFMLMPWNGKAYGSPELKAKLNNEMILTQNMVPVLKSIVANDPLLKLIYDELPFGAIETFSNINSGFVEFLLGYVNILKGQLRISVTTTLSCKPIKCRNAVLQPIFN